MATQRGFIHYFDLATKKKTQTLKVETTLQSSTMSFSNVEKNEAITDIVLFRDDSMAIISTKSGRIVIYNLENGSKITEFQRKEGRASRIKKIKLCLEQNKLYSIDENSVIECNLTLGAVIFNHDFEGASDVCFVNNSEDLLVGGLSSRVSLIRKSQQGPVLMQTSLRAVNLIKGISGSTVAIAGADNVIDIWKNSTRVMTLFAE